MCILYGVFTAPSSLLPSRLFPLYLLLPPPTPFIIVFLICRHAVHLLPCHPGTAIHIWIIFSKIATIAETWSLARSPPTPILQSLPSIRDPNPRDFYFSNSKKSSSINSWETTQAKFQHPLHQPCTNLPALPLSQILY